ncbi:MAG TPA: glycoside hydrolase family 13 protein [Bacteroidales bacterium]|nr:glycoside hydrolase family 13 protein [Bacteroidales bacterium]HPT01930.1 glycoside hydrolase family 13 protein [Bacteroidales bacterium]
MKKLSILALICLSFIAGQAQVSVDRVEPPFWWVGMKEPVVQVMVHGKNIGKTNVSVKATGVKIVKTQSPNADYVFIDLKIARNTKPLTVVFDFKDEGKTITTWNYELKARENGSARRKSFSTADNFYLIMPDRFANGDPSNDDMPGMLEKANRNDPNGRHGGDIKGITDHLDYLQKLGITALWCTPLLENNMPAYSYHGYAITDLYKIDPRFGTNENYRDMVAEAHRKGIKVVMDMVFNHFGTEHWMMKNLPQKDWINQWPEFTRSNYRAAVVTDPYASEYDLKRMSNGWFDKTMADFNQKNAFVANYLIQNSIWWVEYAGLDGIRQDTYPYADKDFMAMWMKRLREEYPDFRVVGEAWLNTPAQLCYWMDNTSNKDGYRSRLTNVFDFPLAFAVQKAFSEEEGFDTGLRRLYDLLTMDVVYADPSDMVIFGDNHDIERMYQVQKTGENMKMAIAFLCTTRGIPLIYYGTEALSDRGSLEGDAGKRKDFPGGWQGDKTNMFTGENLSQDQQEIYRYIKVLLNWRKGNKAVQEGKLTHFIPENGIYVYFRTLLNQSVMVILNNNKESVKVNTERYNEMLDGYKKGVDAVTGATIKKLDKIDIDGKSARIIELSK